MRVATYCRFSTTNQHDKTIEDQRSNCREFDARHPGWREVAAYEDKGKSGMTARRTGYLRLMADARAGAFDVVLMDSSSRLHRKVYRQLRDLEELKHMGIRCVSCDGAIDTDSENFAVMVMGVGMANQLQVTQGARQIRTSHRWAFTNGHWVSVAPFGYDLVRSPEGRRHNAKLVINPERAKVVLMIYRWFASGKTVFWICNELNRRGVPNLRGQRWNYTSLYPNPERRVGVLCNPAYVGKPTWGRTEWRLHPTLDRRVSRLRDRSEWVERDEPSLRIVSDELWNQVQRRVRKLNEESAERKRRLGTNGGPGRRGDYLLSGVLRCAGCGSPYVIVRCGGRKYGCGGRRRDPLSCHHNREIGRDVLEAAVLRAVEDTLFDEAEIARVLQALRSLKQNSANLQSSDPKKQLARVNREIANVVAAIKAGIYTETTRQELERLEAERERLRRPIVDPVIEVERRLNDRQRALRRLRTLATSDVVAARTALQGLVGDTVTCHQTQRGIVFAAIRGRIAGLLAATLPDSNALQGC